MQIWKATVSTAGVSANIQARTFIALKSMASRICNKYRRPIDEMIVTNPERAEQPVRFIRHNRVYPNGNFTPGSWI